MGLELSKSLPTSMTGTALKSEDKDSSLVIRIKERRKKRQDTPKWSKQCMAH